MTAMCEHVGAVLAGTAGGAHGAAIPERGVAA